MIMFHTTRRTAVLGVLAALSVCLAPAASSASARAVFGYTHLQPDGNRWMPGRGMMPRVQPLDIPLLGEPRWVVSAQLSAPVPQGAGSLWVVVLDDGRVLAFRVSGGPRVGIMPVAITPERLPSGTPPLLSLRAGVPTLVTSPDGDASPLTHPVPLAAPDSLAYIGARGDFVLDAGGTRRRLNLEALPDARIVTDGSRRAVILTGPTDRYAHGVLGDKLEAASITIVDTGPRGRWATRSIRLPKEGVVEGIAPIWADLGGDRRREIVVTVSDEERGAQIQAYREDGRFVAAGPAIGQGFRWRHPLAVARFGPAGERELAVVRTPHIGGVVEFYRLSGKQLRIVAEVPGYTSHVLGSRNLDMAAAGDFDGDGAVELLVPDQERTALGAIRRAPGGARVAWTVPLGGRLSTNLSAVEIAGGRLAVGAGREGRVLRLWLPTR